MKNIVTAVIPRKIDFSKYLLQKEAHDGNDVWVFPNAEVQEVESGFSCLVRMLSKQFGIVSNSFIKLNEFEYSHDGETYHVAAYFVTNYTGDLKVNDDKETCWSSYVDFKLIYESEWLYCATKNVWVH